LFDQGIIQNKNMGGGSVRPAPFWGENSKFRAEYIGLRGGVGREELDIMLEVKTIINVNNQLIALSQIKQSPLPSQYMTVCADLCYRPTT
jgi:hypothetical protein